MKDKLATIAVWAGFGTLLFGPGIYSAITDKESSTESQSVKAEPICKTEPIAYISSEEDAPDLDVGDNEYQSGTTGEREICELPDGSITNIVTQDPGEEVTRNGTRPVYIQEADQEYTGCPITTCNDGWCSSSTGSGTCSYHDGVRSYN